MTTLQVLTELQQQYFDVANWVMPKGRHRWTETEQRQNRLTDGQTDRKTDRLTDDWLDWQKYGLETWTDRDEDTDKTGRDIRSLHSLASSSSVNPGWQTRHVNMPLVSSRHSLQLATLSEHGSGSDKGAVNGTHAYPPPLRLQLHGCC